MISSISCMGNPAVWWFGLVGAAVRAGCAQRGKSRAPKAYVILVLIGFASQFLPWVLVPRSTFIYHYFASVPFIILASVLMLDRLRGEDPMRENKRCESFSFAAALLCGIALLLFIAFYPLESGTPVARWYAQLLRWFKWYNF